MRTFLGVCLLLGVAAALLPSAFGLQCAVCKWVGEPNNCDNYTAENSDFYETCVPEPNYRRMCKIMQEAGNSEGRILRECVTSVGIPGCKRSGTDGYFMTCLCDTDLCNESFASATASIKNYTDHNPPDTDNDRSPSDLNNGNGNADKANNGRSGQARALKGPCFGILGMVLFLGGVGGQLFWG